MKKCIGMRINFEPADTSVGIMGESFSAWPLYAGKNDGPWVELVDVATHEMRWEDSATGKPCQPPPEAEMIERALLAFVDAYYGSPESERSQFERRGVDFPCEGCEALEGSELSECNACGYPGK